MASAVRRSLSVGSSASAVSSAGIAVRRRAELGQVDRHRLARELARELLVVLQQRPASASGGARAAPTARPCDTGPRAASVARSRAPCRRCSSRSRRSHDRAGSPTGAPSRAAGRRSGARRPCTVPSKLSSHGTACADWPRSRLSRASARSESGVGASATTRRWPPIARSISLVSCLGDGGVARPQLRGARDITRGLEPAGPGPRADRRAHGAGPCEASRLATASIDAS